MMLLGIDTSTASTSVAIADASGVLASSTHVGSRDHGAFLAPAIAECLDRAGLGVAALDGVAVGTGPGLYTGLRVGIATAAALAHARGIPIVGVCGLDVLARTAARAARTAEASTAAEAEVLATIDARRGQVFWARYAPASDAERSWVRLDGPRVSGRDELDAAIAARIEHALASGAPAPRIVGEVATDEVAYPDAGELLRIARPLLADAGDGYGGAADLVPLYLREADVRIGWAERGGGRGGAG